MPSRPPDNPFYQNAKAAQFWRDVSRSFEDLFGSSKEDRRAAACVLSDIVLMLDPYRCNLCQTPMENADTGVDTELKCPSCGWMPVSVTAYDGRMGT